MGTLLQQFLARTMGLRAKTSITVTSHIDQEAIAKRLKVDKRARKEARENRPATTADGPDANEKAIVSYYRTIWRALHAWYRDALKRAQGQQDQAAAQWATEHFDACYDAAQHELTTQDVRLRDPLLAARRRERRALRDLKAFRDEYDLAQEAHYPASLSLHYAVLVVMVVIEAAANSYFFARGSDYGLLGGLLEALIVASVNVALAFYAGVALRGLHSSGARRLLAAAVGVLYVGVLALYHLAVGHYRMALGGNMPERAASDALVHLTHAPLAISDLQTWLLMLVGVLFAIGAVIAGYTSDDPIIGYGAVTRRFQAAEAAYHGLKEQYLSGIRAVVDMQLSAVDSRVGEAKAAMTAYRASVAETRRLRRSYEMECAALVDACIATQQRYRKTNEAIRTTVPPTYFAEAPRHPFEPDEVLGLDLAAVAEAEHITTDWGQRLGGLHTTADTVKHRLRELYTTYLYHAPAYFARIEEGADSPPLPHHGGDHEGEHAAHPRREVSNGVPHVKPA